MKYNINCIYNYYDTLLSEWGEWNKHILVGSFSNDATNLSEALGITTSDGRSRAKELFRIGLLTHELTKGMAALNSAKNGENLQTRFGFIVALIYQAYEKKQTGNLLRAVAAINSIFSLIQPFEMNGLSVATNTIVQKLLEVFPVPDGYERATWLRFLISGFCCELKVAKDGTNITDFVRGKEKGITLRLIDNKSNDVRASFSNPEELKKAIDKKTSLTNIHHQKMALFLLGSAKDIEPRGFFGIADKYFSQFLRDAYLIESIDVDNSPFKSLYIDDEGANCQKANVIEVLKQITTEYSEFEKSYKDIMKSIEEGAVEALMFLTDKPKSAFTNNWRPSSELSNDSSTLSFFTALRTKPFLLLAGISGTGKSQKVQELAFMSCPESLQDPTSTTPGNYCLVEVKPNWHDSTELLGYYSALSGKYELTKFIRFAYKAIKNPEYPFFLCLDEMNLAPVEQYFAEYLSVLETRKKTEEGIKTQPLLPKDNFSNCKLMGTEPKPKNGYTLDGDDYQLKPLYSPEDAEIITYLKENGLQLPNNLFVIGTVNMDDTTHQFSRKVIDRAFTIEMNGGKMADMFTEKSKLLLEYRSEPVALDAFRAEFVKAYDVLEDERFAKYAEDISTKVPSILGNSDGTEDNSDSINGILNKTPFRVSYRVQNELVLYLSVLIQNAGFPDDIDNLIGEATLAILLEKILPRIQGEQKQLETQNGKSNILKDLEKFVSDHFAFKPQEGEETKENPLLTKVIKKLEEMDSKLSGYYTNFF